MQGDFAFSLDHLPLHFVENKGQLSEKVRFHAGQRNFQVYLAPGEVVYAFVRKEPAGPDRGLLPASGKRTDVGRSELKTQVFRTVFEGANTEVDIRGEEAQEAKANFFFGSDPARWVSGAPTYGKILYRNLYPQIDLWVCGDQESLKLEYRVRPGGNVDEIKMRYLGAEEVGLDAAGSLKVKGRYGALFEEAPVCHQIVAGKKVEIGAAFRIDGGGVVRFRLEDFDPHVELVIDPEVQYSSFLGGGSVDRANGIAVDGNGYAYVTGSTTTSNFPVTAGAYDTSYNSLGDVFVAKFNYPGTGLVYSTFIGGSAEDCADGIVVDSGGKATVTGRTGSTNFPTTSGAFDRTHGGGNDIFVTTLNAAGSALVYSTFLGGSADDEGTGVAVDSSGNAYISGKTESANYPTTPGAFDTSYNGSPYQDAVLSKIDSSGATLVYSTYLGGSQDDAGYGLDVDSGGSAYVTGETGSSNFPVTAGAYDTTKNSAKDVFAAKLNPAGTDLLYSTYIGGSQDETGFGLAVDGSGNALIIGATTSSNFPTTAGAYDSSHNGYSDVFVVKLNSGGSGLLYSTYLGGSFDDFGTGIAADDAGVSCLVGRTESADFPASVNAYDSSHNGYNDVFIAKFSSSGSILLYSTYLGGGFQDYGTAVGADKSGTVYISGYTESSDFPVTPGAYDVTFNGNEDVFVFALSGALPAVPVPKHALGDFDGDGTNEVAVDFGAAGISVWDEGTWTSIAAGDPESMTAGNFDGVADDEIAADFGPAGLWVWNNSAWGSISGLNPDRIVTADTDGNGRLEILGDFGTAGLWRWNGTSWSQLSGVDADVMIAADVDGNGDDEVIGDFSASGLWQWNAGSWTQLSGVDADVMIAADTDGSGDEEVLADFGSSGLWERDGSIWTGITSADSDFLAAADLEGNGDDELLASFGALGTWLWNSFSWTKVSSAGASDMVTADIDGNNDEEVAVDFGALGLWLRNGTQWSQLSSLNPESLTSGNVDGDGADEILADFGSLGLWLWDNTTWTQISPLNPD